MQLVSFYRHDKFLLIQSPESHIIVLSFVNIKVKRSYPDNKDRSDLVGRLAELVAKNLPSLVLLVPQRGTSWRLSS